MSAPLIDLRRHGRRRRFAPFAWSTLKVALDVLGRARQVQSGVKT